MVPLVVILITVLFVKHGTCDCIAFELITGYVYSAPDDIIVTKQGILHLAECIDFCRHNSSCHGVNFETGLCVLFAVNQDAPGSLSQSQFPVFTIFAQKVSLKSPLHCCGRPWLFEVVKGQRLTTSYIRRRVQAKSRKHCMEMCLAEKDFECRSANYASATGGCALSDMDRFTVTALNSLTTDETVSYLESNCIQDPIKMCDFTSIKGQILKTVESVHQDVANVPSCRKLCLEETNYRCHSFDYGDTGAKVCRLSHHSMASLQHIEEPYLELEQATTYELTGCYNVTIDCRASDMVVHVNTNKVFNGKVYAKNRPNSCATDVVNSLEFDIHLGYHDLNCDILEEAPGRFTSDIIIQHHDQIVTSQDIGLSVRCAYSLQNRSVGLGVELQVDTSQNSLKNEENSFVVSPTVTMRITDRQGADIHTAQVGDALSLRFQIIDADSPYQIFVRELIALDGVDSSEILLIDSLGCPTDPTIMGPISVVPNIAGSTVILQAPFDAFKFPSSQVVQFKALVTPCLPACEPVVCELNDYFGAVRSVNSYGRRKRSEIRNKDDMLVIQTISITDKFQFDQQVLREETGIASIDMESGKCFFCLNTSGFVSMTSVVVLCVQLVVGVGYFVIYRRRRRTPQTIQDVTVPYQQPWSMP